MSKAEISQDKKKAILVGSEGFVGKYVLERLVKHRVYAQVKVIAQNKPSIESDKVEVILSPIEKVDLTRDKVDDLFICYDASFFNAGGKYHIPKESYRHIPKMLWQARQRHVGQVMLLSSMRADKDAMATTNRIRGLIEESVSDMGFWGTHIFKPSILIGETLDTDWGQEWSDRIGDRINRLTGGWLRRNKPIEADIVARAMVDAAQKFQSGVHYYSSSWLQDYATVNKRTDISR